MHCGGCSLAAPLWGVQLGRSILSTHPPTLPHGWGALGATSRGVPGGTAGWRGAPTGSEPTRGGPTPLPVGHLPNPACPTGGGRAGATWDRSHRAQVGAKGWGQRRHGAPGPRVGQTSLRAAPRADTRAHTQRGGIPAPRLPTAPFGAASGMWEPHPGEGHGASPGLRAPSARPPHHRPRGIGAAARGAGGWRGGPARRGAGTGVRARSRTAPLPLCRGWHPPKPGRRKRSPAGGLCHRKP